MCGRICTGEARITVYEQEESEPEAANVANGVGGLVMARQSSSEEMLGTEDSDARLLPAASYLQVEAQGEMGISVLLITASSMDAHKSIQCYAIKAQGSADSRDGEQQRPDMRACVELEKAESHPALHTSIPFTGSAWGPCKCPENPHAVLARWCLGFHVSPHFS
jgi:hypothetical protein